jgi:VanZ family protein
VQAIGVRLDRKPENSWPAKKKAPVVLVLTLAPKGNAPSLAHDKLQHFASFLALGLLGLGWVTWQSFVMIVALALLGGAVELLQALPMIGRDADVFDWVADLMGVFVAFTIVTGGPSFVDGSKYRFDSTD